MVEPVHPFQRRKLDGFKAPQWPASMNDFSFVEAVDGLCQSIIIAVADTAYRRFDARFSEALSVFYGHVLGRFNRSSQHPEQGCYDEDLQAPFISLNTR